MPRMSWNWCAVIVAASLCVGCAKPASTTAPHAPEGGMEQSSSTTGGGAEVPMTAEPTPAATEETPAEPTPAPAAEEKPAETPAEPAAEENPAEAKPE